MHKSVAPGSFCGTSFERRSGARSSLYQSLLLDNNRRNTSARPTLHSDLGGASTRPTLHSDLGGASSTSLSALHAFSLPFLQKDRETGVYVFWGPPIQHREEGDPDAIHATPWGASFFDLLFVAAAYKLGNVFGCHLQQGEDAIYGLFVFWVLLLNFSTVWLVRLSMTVRFHTTDIVHTVTGGFEFMLVALAIYFTPYQPFLGLKGGSPLDDDDDYHDHYDDPVEEKESGRRRLGGESDDDRVDVTPAEALRDHTIYATGMQLCIAACRLCLYH